MEPKVPGGVTNGDTLLKADHQKVAGLGSRMAVEKKMLVTEYKASGLPKPPTPSFTGTKFA